MRSHTRTHVLSLILLASMLFTPMQRSVEAQDPLPYLVKDINICTESALPGLLAQTDNKVYFSAHQAGIGTSLWRTDGTEAGTVRIKILDADASLPVSGLNLWLSNTFFFLTGSAADGYSLWASDGTEAGTRWIKDLISGINPSFISKVVATNGALYFAFTQGWRGNAELWRSDGTVEGTLSFTTIQYGQNMDFSGLTAFQGYLYFSGWDAEHGIELWRSDGTAAGTVLFMDLNPTSDSRPDSFYTDGDTFYFIARHQTNRWVLWDSNGTQQGTHPILTEGYSATFGDFASLNNILYFLASSTGGLRIWRTDGTDAGTWRLKDVPVEMIGKTWHGLGVVGSTLYFQANGTELWKSDGSEASTSLVKNITFNNRAYSPANFMDVGGVAYFGATDSDGISRVLWRSDGTASGTNIVDTGHLPDTLPYISSVPYVINQSKVLYSGYVVCAGGELLIVDETPVVDGIARAELVKDIETKTQTSDFEKPNAYQGQVYFSATQGKPGSYGEMWASDGTPAGTRLVKTFDGIKPGLGGLQPNTEMASANGLLFFTAWDVLYTQLWRTDGSETGTVRLTDLPADFPLDGPHDLTPYNNQLFFLNNAAGYEELWASDGTLAGTHVISSFGGALTEASRPVELNGWLYLLVVNTNGQLQLYRSNGTNSGTTLVRAWDNHGVSSPGSFVKAGGRIFFTAWDADHGRELWSSDGTITATQLYTDMAPGAASAGIETLTTAGDTVIFSTWVTPDWTLWKASGTDNKIVKLLSSTDQVLEVPSSQGGGHYIYFTIGNYTPRSLWRTDGTPEGTIQLRFLVGDDMNDSNLAAVGDQVFFSASDPEHGWELWTSDGTVEGTRLAFDLNPGSGSSNPESLHFVNGALWFRADDGLHGSEPWIYDFLTERFYLPVVGR